MGKLDVGEKFWILVSNDTVAGVFNDQGEAIKELKAELRKKKKDTVIAEMQYEPKYNEEEQGEFKVNPISWKDIAMGLVEEEEDENEGDTEEKEE